MHHSASALTTHSTITHRQPKPPAPGRGPLHTHHRTTTECLPTYGVATPLTTTTATDRVNLTPPLTHFYTAG
jgi:hypothetical protein